MKSIFSAAEALESIAMDANSSRASTSPLWSVSNTSSKILRVAPPSPPNSTFVWVTFSANGCPRLSVYLS